MSDEVTMLKSLNGVVFSYASGKFHRITNREIVAIVDAEETSYVRPQVSQWKHNFVVTGPTFRPFIFDRAGLIKQFDNAPLCELSVIFREHLVCANIIEHEGKADVAGVFASDLRKFDEWRERSDTEAGKYYLELFESPFTGARGITGLKQLGPSCLIYTPGGIYAMSYTGLKRGVYSLDLFYSEIGSIFKFGVVGSNRQHFFIGEDNIFMLASGVSGVDDGLTEIGQPIMEYFQDTITTNSELRQRTWGYYDKTQGEVCWLYYGKGSEVINKAIIFSIYERKWYVDEPEDIHSFDAAKINDVFTNYDSLIGQTYDDLVGKPFASFNSAEVIYSRRLFGSADLAVLTDAFKGQTYVPKPLPFVETKDEHYNDLELVKEVNEFKLQCTYDETNCEGIEVQISTRVFLDDPVEFVTVGLWTNDLRFAKLTFPTRAGVIFRFKFIPKPKDTTIGVDTYTISGWSYTINEKSSTRGDR